MISIRKRFIFIHVPKTGGNSIQDVLRNYSEDDIVVLRKHQDGIDRFQVRNKKYSTTKHSTLSQYKSVLNADLYSSLFKFATIRNPWDMMISFYFSPHRGVKEWDRDAFLFLVKNTPNLRQYICEKPSTAKINADLDFLMRFEQLNQDFDTVCKRLEIPFSSLPIRNKSTRKHYYKYYDDALINVVGEKFREEIEFGNYSFEAT